MSSQTLACPQCHTSLRSNRPLNETQLVRCPQCGNHFHAGVSSTAPTLLEAPAAPEPMPAPTPRPVMSAPLVLFGVALLASIVIIGGGIAAAIYFTRPRGDDLARIEAERKALAEEREKLNADGNKLDFADFMKKGEAAMAKKDFAAAAKAYGAALALFPNDADAKKGLTDAKIAAAVDGKLNEDKEKRKADYAGFMEKGKKALAAKEWSDAVRAFESAIQVMPGDEDANKGLSEARSSLAALQDDKAKSADYQARMDAGREAVKNGRYPDAVREYLAALRLVPGDDAATKALQEAEKKIGDVQDAAKRKADFDHLLDRAKAALRDKRYDDAIDSSQAALLLMPNDKDATNQLADARKARTDARTEYVRLVDKATGAFRSGQFEQAKSLFTDANRLFPDEASAKNGLRDAQKALDDQAAFVRAVKLAEAAYAANNYNQALGYYNDALVYRPDDVETLERIRKLRKHLERDVGDAVEFDRQMAIGKIAFDRKEYEKAAAAFRKAVDLSPGNVLAIDSLHRANYEVDMAAGRAASNAKRYRDAVRAYEDALQEIPGDPAATNALEQAKINAKIADGIVRPTTPTKTPPATTPRNPGKP
jgi:tetratricopeptide (TPR) repeat protein